MILYKKMSLFDAPQGSVLTHSCNCQGVWGSGIAKEFKARFPQAYKQYSEACMTFGLVGVAFLIEDANYHIGCLLTSSGYAGSLDPVDNILVNTTLSLDRLCQRLDEAKIHTVYSNKFNSGLFKVPWSETERILKVFVERYHLNWVVCDPDMKENNG